MLLSYCFRLALVVFPLLWPLSSHGANHVVPAVITSISEGAGSVGYVTWTNGDALDAEVGRWDTPYPYPDTGQYAPGLQPTGRSTLLVNINVNDGGYATFRYKLQTYDAGIWDWYDIWVDTPDGRISIVDHLGKPGSQYGTYWESAYISVGVELSRWRNQTVTFGFSVMQDGWGDQTQGLVRGFKIDTCPVPPLTPIERFGPEAVEFENLTNRFVTDQRFQLQTELACMQNQVTAAGGTYVPVSAYRSTGYQQHLREIWDTQRQLGRNTTQQCTYLKREVQREFDDHELLSSQQPAVNSRHERGQAFDMRVSGLGDIQIDIAAATCGLYRFDPISDPNHFHRP